jgi:hypothetical protein
VFVDLMLECVSSKTTGRCSRRCFPANGSKWRGISGVVERFARRVVAYADTTCGKGLVVALVRAKLERWTDVSDVALLTPCATAIRSSHHPNGRIQFLKLALKWARHHPDTNSIVSLSGLR